METKLEQSFTSGIAIDAAAFETLKRLQSSRGNSVLLHEYYFDGIALQSDNPPAEIRGAIEKRFGSIEKWAADFVGSANAAAGWAVLVIHPVNGKLYNVVSDEHAQGPLWLAFRSSCSILTSMLFMWTTKTGKRSAWRSTSASWTGRKQIADIGWQ